MPDSFDTCPFSSDNNGEEESEIVEQKIVHMSWHLAQHAIAMMVANVEQNFEDQGDEEWCGYAMVHTANHVSAILEAYMKAYLYIMSVEPDVEQQEAHMEHLRKAVVESEFPIMKEWMQEKKDNMEEADE